MLAAKAAGFWFVLLAVAVAMGAARDAWLAPSVGDFRAHQLETVCGCAVFALLIVGFVRRVRATRAQAWRVGLGWTVATIAFEFLFFGLVMRRPLADLVAAYALWRGELWPLLLLTTLLAPPLAARRRG